MKLNEQPFMDAPVSPFEYMNSLVKNLLGANQTNDSYQVPDTGGSTSIEAIFTRTIEDLEIGADIIADWGAKRAFKAEDYPAIEALSILNLMSAFMLEAHRVLGEEKAKEIYRRAIDRSETFIRPSDRIIGRYKTLINNGEID
jgi:hypothetical protein